MVFSGDEGDEPGRGNRRTGKFRIQRQFLEPAESAVAATAKVFVLRTKHIGRAPTKAVCGVRYTKTVQRGPIPSGVFQYPPRA